MADIDFMFNRAKAIEVILYLASKVSNSDIYGICKLLYLVDKTNLEKYGRFIFGESYVAMQEGATPSNAYDLLKEASESSVTGLSVDTNQVVALREANLDYLSESDVECLDQIISIYGKAPNWVRRRDTHDDAWKKAWASRGNMGSVRIPVESIAKLLSDSDDIISHLSNSDDG